MPEDDRPPDNIVPYDLLVDEWLERMDSRRETERKRHSKREIGMKLNG